MRRIITWSGALGAIFMVVWIVLGEEPKKRVRYEKDRVGNVLSSGSLQNVSMEGLYAQVKDLTAEREKDARKIARLQDDLTRAQNGIAETQAKKKIQALETRYDNLLNEFEFLRQEVKKKGVVVEAGTTEDSAKPTQPKAQVAATSDEDGVLPLEENDLFAQAPEEDNTYDDEGFEQEAYGSPKSGTSSSSSKGEISNFRMVTLGEETQAQSENEVALSTEDETESPYVNIFDNEKAFLPMGSIIQTVSLTGVDAPVGEGARQNPVPVIMRVKNHALLANRFKMDLRECFILTSGHGDFSSARVKLRGESISCVKEDGTVIETAISGFVSGEDGKEGAKGRVVSKQGSLLGNAALAGFIEGLSGAFDVSAVPTIATTSASGGGTQAFNQIMSRELRQSAVVNGAKGAMAKIADFYIGMAEQMMPVIEVGAGRNLTFLTTKGILLQPATGGQRNRPTKHNTVQKAFGGGNQAGGIINQVSKLGTAVQKTANTLVQQ